MRLIQTIGHLSKNLTLLVGTAAVATAQVPETIGFEPFESYATGNVPELIEMPDLNDDGHRDVVLINSDAESTGGGNSVSVLLSDGQGGFDNLGEFEAGDRPEGLAIADVNSDSHPDVITSNFEGNTVSILLGNGDGTLAAPAKIDVAGGPRGVVAADFNGDGNADLATSNFDGDSVSILLGDGTGGFTVSSTITVGNGPEALAVGELNGDGNLDLITVNQKASIGDPPKGTVTPLTGDGNGAFTAQPAHRVGKTPRYVIPVDLNNDGLDDLLVANNTDHTISVEENIGSGAFENRALLDHPQLRRPVVLDYIDVGDDGFSDVVVNSARDNAVIIFQGNATPFDYPEADEIYFGTGTAPVGVKVADVDEDGFQDILVTNAEDNTLYVYRSYRGNPGIIVDNDDPGASQIGTWQVSEGPQPFGADSLSSNSGGRFGWTADLPAAGEYEVFLWWTVTPSRNNDVPVFVDTATGTENIIVDQRTGAGVWHSLGVYEFGSEAAVSLVAPNNVAITACADAVRFVAQDSVNLPPMATIDFVAPNPGTFGEPVDFSGRGSDSDGSIATYRWTSNLDGFLSDKATFSSESLSVGLHTIELIVEDDLGATSAAAVEVVEILEPRIDPPVADAGEDRTVNEGQRLTLDGSASQPGMGGSLTYLWEQVSGPAITIANPTSSVIEITAPIVIEEQEIGLQLTVREGDVEDADTVLIRVRDIGSGAASFTFVEPQSDVALSGRNVLAFQGRVTAQNDMESEDWVEATFATRGSDPGARLVQAWLYVDANGNGTLEETEDLQLGDAAMFAPGESTLRFSNYVQTLVDGESAAFFVVAELAPEVVEDPGDGVAFTLPLPRGGTLAMLLAATVLAALLSGAMPRRALRGATAVLLLSATLPPLSGCGGGGGGGGPVSEEPEPLQLELTTVEIIGTSSGKPTAISGLPIVGQEF